MKRFFLAILFLSSFGFVSAIFAGDVYVPFEVPFSYGGYTFDKFFCYKDTSQPAVDFDRCFYSSSGAYHQLSLYYGNLTNKIYSQESTEAHHFQCGKSNYLNYNSCLDTLTINTVPLWDWAASSWTFEGLEYLSNLPVYDGYFNYVLTELLYPANYPFTLSISRSPELGGGVVITHPDTFEYQCGTEGQEECEFDDLTYNSQVTLEAQHNEGYAFSHWEINNQTMGDVDGTITVTMNESKVVKAVFKPVLNFPLSGTLENRELEHFFFGDTWNCAQCGQCPTGTYKLHTGTDLNATYDYQNEVGERVDAAHSGTVKKIYTGQHSVWADAIVIESSDGQFTTVYWHVIKYGSLVENDPVTKGQQIATIADLSDNTHFHFGIRMAPYSDPESYAGALPVADGCGYLAFPENFISPKTVIYE